jgi:hypothetical protein
MTPRSSLTTAAAAAREPAAVVAAIDEAGYDAVAA